MWRGRTGEFVGCCIRGAQPDPDRAAASNEHTERNEQQRVRAWLLRTTAELGLG